MTRDGRQRELQGYFASASGLQEAALAFCEAEFDLCGSVPLALMRQDDDEEDEDGDHDDGSVLSVVGRWDYRITDPDALVDAGRRAYLNAWPDDPLEDAALRVVDPGSAVGEILHGDALSDLLGAPGLERHQFSIQVVTHVGGDDFDNNPFGLVARTTRTEPFDGRQGNATSEREARKRHFGSAAMRCVFLPPVLGRHMVRRCYTTWNSMR